VTVAVPSESVGVLLIVNMMTLPPTTVPQCPDDRWMDVSKESSFVGLSCRSGRKWTSLAAAGESTWVVSSVYASRGNKMPSCDVFTNVVVKRECCRLM